MDDRELKTFCREFRKGLLNGDSSKGQCAKVTWALQGFISFALQIKSEVHESTVGDWNHLYLVLSDGRVLDCTGDQFGKKYPQVYLGKPLAIHQGERYDINAALRNL